VSQTLFQQMSQAVALQAQARLPPPRETFAAPDSLRALRDRLFAQADPLVHASTPRQRLYVLVDPMQADPLAEVAHRAEAIVLPMPPTLIAPEDRPYLLPLGDFGRDDTIDLTLDLAWAEATRHARRPSVSPSICAWLVGPADNITRFAYQLFNRSRARIPPDIRARWLRYWDPRVFSLFADALPAAALTDLTVDAAGWWWLDRHGELQARPMAAADAREWAWTPSTTSLVRHTDIINRTLNTLQDSGGAHSDGLWKRILPLVERAIATWDIQDTDELVRYTLYGMLISPQFDQYPETRQAMRAAIDNGTSPMAALTSFDTAYWEAPHHG
jgi:hypothetical protein